MRPSAEREALIARTEIVDVRAVELHGVVEVVELPDEVEVSISVDDPKYVVRNSELVIRFAHTVEFLGPPEEKEDGGQGTASPLAKVRVGHIAIFSVTGDDPDKTEIDDMIMHNSLFVIHPYARAAIRQLCSDLDLPPVILPYLRRNPIAPPTARHRADEPEYREEHRALVDADERE